MKNKPFSPSLRRGAWLVSALLVAGLAQPARAASSVVYSSDFEGPVGSEWSSTTADVTPTGSRRFLGQFGNSTVNLNLVSLPAHSSLSVDFDLYIIRSWDGNDPGASGGETFDLSVAGGATLLHTNFSNGSAAQAYPGAVGAANTARTAAIESNTLGYTPVGDTVYRVHANVVHSGSTVTLAFAGSGLEALANESWGIDNVAVSAVAGSAPVVSNLDHWWQGEGNGNDAIGDANGTSVNAVTYAAGKVGNAFTFNGSNYVQVPDSPGLNFGPTQPLSIELWVKRTGTAPIMHFVGKRNGCGSDSGNYQLALNESSGEGIGFGPLASRQSLPLNTWTHLAGTFDGTTFKIYINGQLVAAASGTNGPVTSAPLTIGGSGSCALTVGMLDEIGMYSRALSANEIAAMYDAGAQGKVLGGKVVFASNRSGNYEIYSMNADGTGVTQLTNDPGTDYWPELSRDGTKIVFQTDRNGNADIYTMNVDGTGLNRVTTNGAGDVYPAFNPTATKIVFSSYRGSDAALLVINADGTDEHTIVDSTYGDYGPAWSPDGSKISFHTFNNSIQSDIYTVNPDGSGMVALTNASGHDSNAQWSPDGTRLVFTSQRDGNEEIYVMNANGTGQTRLTNNAGADALAAFDPTGSRVVFNSSRNGNLDLYRVNLDGSGLRRLTTDAGNDEKPTWAQASTGLGTPLLRVNDVTVTEGNTGSGSALFTVSLATPAIAPVTVAYATADGTALAGTDYTAASGTVSFAPGETTQNITVATATNTLDQNDRTFTVNLASAVNARIDDGVGVGTIKDDDPLPTIALDNPTVTEGNSGTIPMTFTATLSTASGRTVTASYSAQSGTATSGVDFQATSGTITFAPGETSKTITVNIIGDLKDENDETFKVVLSNVVNAGVIAPSAQFNATNNHYYELVVGSLTFDAAKTAAENRIFAGTPGYLASITSAAEQAFILPLLTQTHVWIGGYQTAGSSEPGGGFRWVTSEPFTYTNWSSGEPNNAGTGEDVIEIRPIGSGTWNDVARQNPLDAYLVEYDYGGPSPALPEPQGIGTIIADADPAPTASIADASVTEGNGGTVNCSFNIALSSVSGKDITINFTPTAQTATAGSDFSTVAGTLTIPAGSASGTCVVAVNGDSLVELDETFLVTLSSPQNVTLVGAQATGTIINDDAGNNGGGTGVGSAFTVRQVNLLANDIIYDAVGGNIYASVPGSGGARANSITPINPMAATVGASVAIGTEPGRLCITDNGQYVYTALGDYTNIRRFNIATQTAGLQFNLGTDYSALYAEDMETLPGQPEALMVSRSNRGISPRHKNVVILDNGVARPNFSAGANVIEVAGTSRVFGYFPELSSYDFVRWNYGPTGITGGDITHPIGGNANIKYDNGRIYATNGQIFNPETGVTLGSFPAGVFCPDGANGRVYTVTQSGSTAVVHIFDANTFVSGSLKEIGTLNVTGVSGSVGSLIRWGTNGLAFRTSGGQVYLLRIVGSAAGLTVTTTADAVDAGDGVTSLREAITAANAAPGSIVTFNIPDTDAGYSSGVWTIRPTSALPAITASGTLIEGASQTAFGGDTNTGGPEIFLSGELAGGASNGLNLTAADGVVHGLAVGNFGAAGVRIGGAGATNNAIQGCNLGLSAVGVPAPNGVGLWLTAGASNNFIGGTTAGNINRIAGNYGDGVVIDAANSNLIAGNTIGILTGANSQPNGGNGVILQNGASANSIGGIGSGFGNTISGNGTWGVAIIGSSANNSIHGNKIGTDTTASSAVSNGFGGVYVDSSSGTSIGSSLQAGINIISGNAGNGIYLYGAPNTKIRSNGIGTNGSATGPLGNTGFGVWADQGSNNITLGGTTVAERNLIADNYQGGIYLSGINGGAVTGNYIGVNYSGTTALANGSVDFPEGGILIAEGASNITVGGMASGSGNLIANNIGAGITIGTDASDPAAGNALRGNTIHSNTALGIDLKSSGEDAAGVTPNDAGDGDSGPNGLQNYPVFTSIISANGATVIQGSLNSTPSATFAVDIYTNTTGDASGYGEGQTFLTTTSVTTDGNGDAAINLTLTTSSLIGKAFSAIATNASGNTSEFGPVFVALADTVAPVAAITSPAEGASGETAPPVTGTASDTGGTGVGSVTVALRRAAANGAPEAYYNWNNGALDVTYNQGAHEKTASGTASWSLTLPSTLPGGSYQLRATAIDLGGNRGNSDWVGFTLTDETAPTASITAPANLALSNSFTTATGTASDGGVRPSGVAKVTVMLTRLANGGDPASYWAGGNNWTADYTAEANNIIATGTTSWSQTLPALIAGNYSLEAFATDVAGNDGSAAETLFAVELTPPTVTVATPANGGIYGTLATATGTVADDSGVMKVTGRLYRAANGVVPAGYWAGGSTWTATYSAANEKQATGISNWSLTLPTLPDGNYNFRATATDVAGNVAVSTVNSFRIDKTTLVVAVTAPAPDNVKVKAAPALTGTAANNVTQVTCWFFRYANGPTPAGYWAGGSTWTPTYSAANERACTGTANWSLALPALVEGNYAFRATATDVFGKKTSTQFMHFTVDTTAPTLTVTAPVPENVKLTVMPTSIPGTAGDTVSGIARVTGWFFRYANGGTPAGYWAGGNTWTATYTAVNDIVCTGTTSWSLGLPALPDGSYAFRMTATDGAGNQLTKPIGHFSLDTVAPVVNIATPAANGAYKSITSATGTASDAGAGVTRVTGRLFREANGPTPAGYWAGGTTWTPTYSVTNERLCTGTTSWSLALPTLPDGSYSFRATATDGAGNTTASAVHSFMVDNVAPALVITQPATENGSYSSVPALTGTSSDGGSGVNRVTAWLYRYVNGGTPAGYWASGSTWTAGVNELVCTGTTAWSLTTPTLPAGNYAFRVTVFDNAGNSLQSAFRHFTITPAGSPGIGPSGAGASGLSTASAKATTNSVTLVFNNALDADSAADASHYAVTINGTSATVTGVAYAASSRSVVLTLESGALHAGDQVVAVWSGVLGASGTSYSGQTGSLTAK